MLSEGNFLPNTMPIIDTMRLLSSFILLFRKRGSIHSMVDREVVSSQMTLRHPRCLISKKSKGRKVTIKRERKGREEALFF